MQHHLEVIRNLCRDKTVQIMLLWAPIRAALLFGELEKVFKLQKEGRRNNCNLHSFSPFCCKCCSVLRLVGPQRRGYSPRSGHVCQDNGSKLTPGPERHTCWEKKWHTSFCSAVRLAFSLSPKQRLETGKIEIACTEVSKRKYFQHWREDNNLLCTLCWYTDKACKTNSLLLRKMKRYGKAG